MIVIYRGNIGDLKNCSYPTIKCFLVVVQLFDAKFMTIAPHILVVFQLQYARHVKNALSINKHIYITWKVSKEKKHSEHIYIIKQNLIFL